jgi:hypothetical protein
VNSSSVDDFGPGGVQHGMIFRFVSLSSRKSQDEASRLESENKGDRRGERSLVYVIFQAGFRSSKMKHETIVSSTHEQERKQSLSRREV